LELQTCNNDVASQICDGITIDSWSITATGTDTCNTLDTDCYLQNVINAGHDDCGTGDGCFILDNDCTFQNLINNQSIDCVAGDGCFNLENDCSMTHVEDVDGHECELVDKCLNPNSENWCWEDNHVCHILDDDCEVGNIGYPDIYIYGSAQIPGTADKKRPEFVAYHLNKQCNLSDAITIIDGIWENGDSISGPDIADTPFPTATAVYSNGNWNGALSVLRVNGGYDIRKSTELTFKWNEECVEVT
jgi:hypothetical protein